MESPIRSLTPVDHDFFVLPKACLAMKLVWQCDACGLRGPANSGAIVERLQRAGLLKRAAKEERQDQAYLLAVAESAGARLACPACGAAGLHLGDEQHDPFDGSRPCAAC